MEFDDLFINDYWHKNNETGEECPNKFFQYTKAMYETQEILISVKQVKNIQENLKDNIWYQYFSEHVREIKTWIDFELKIKEALEIVCEYMSNIEKYLKNKNNLDGVILSFKENKDGEYFLSQKAIRILELLKLLQVEYKIHNYDELGYYQPLLCNYEDEWDITQEENSERFFQKMKGFDFYNYKEVTGFLRNSLIKFSKLFNEYLNLFNNVSCKNKIVNPIENIHRVYSFNYTSTYSKNYDLTVESYFLHGKLNIENKLVLGVSDLDNKLLHKFNLWGFTKYHQKLFFDTDYQFISEFTSKQELICNEIELTKHYWLNKASANVGSVNYINQKIEKVLQEQSLNLNFYIWGHSLDESDSSYIMELFSFNEPHDQKVRITIYYFNDDAKYDLLANLINILTTEKIERWMKKGWLKFEQNPEIAEINNFKPVNLPKKDTLITAS